MVRAKTVMHDNVLLPSTATPAVRVSVTPTVETF